MREKRKPYNILFNAITDALRELDKQNIDLSKKILIKAQQDAEDAWIEEAE